MSTLAADRARLADLDAQILNLERSLSALRSQRQSVFEGISTYSYPVLMLPNEILTEIFVHFLPVYPECPPLTGIHSPNILAQICRQWREIALNTPALWRSISISYYPRFTLSFRDGVDLCNMWLTRSHCYPISLNLNDNSVSSHITEALSAAVVHSARWEHLKLALTTSSVRIIVGPMPLLRSLDVYLVDNDPIYTKVSFLEAPLLRAVVLNDVAAESLTLPWTQLTSLTLRRVYPQECVPILRHASNLVRCVLNLVEDPEGLDVPDITLLSLRSLTLTGCLVTGYPKTLIVPALHDLEIPESFIAPNSINTLTSFMSKSRCKLQRLCITRPWSGLRDPFYKAFPLIAVSFDED